MNLNLNPTPRLAVGSDGGQEDAEGELYRESFATHPPRPPSYNYICNSFLAHLSTPDCLAQQAERTWSRNDMHAMFLDIRSPRGSLRCPRDSFEEFLESLREHGQLTRICCDGGGGDRWTLALKEN